MGLYLSTIVPGASEAGVGRRKPLSIGSQGKSLEHDAVLAQSDC